MKMHSEQAHSTSDHANLFWGNVAEHSVESKNATSNQKNHPEEITFGITRLPKHSPDVLIWLLAVSRPPQASTTIVFTYSLQVRNLGQAGKWQCSKQGHGNYDTVILSGSHRFRHKGDSGQRIYPNLMQSYAVWPLAPEVCHNSETCSLLDVYQWVLGNAKEPSFMIEWLMLPHQYW